MSSFEKGLLWIIRSGVFLLLLTPLIVAPSLFFPYITGKNFFFRVIVEIITGAWVILALIQPRFRPRGSFIAYIFTAFVGVLTLATIAGVDPYHSFWSNFERMEGLVTHLHLFALFLVMGHLFSKEEEWGMFFAASIGVSIIIAGYGFLQAVGLAAIMGGGRPFATFGNSIYLANYLMFHLFLLGAFLYRIRLTWVRVVCAILFLFELYVFYVAASRGVFIGFVFSVSLLALSVLILAKQKTYRTAAIIGLSLIAVGGILLFSFPDSAFVQNSDLLNRLTDISFGQLSREPRIMIWGIAWKAFLARPILGWGPENFIIPYSQFYNPNLYSNEPWFDRAHNMLLEWLVATGIVGFVLYLGIFVSILYVLWALVKKNVIKPFLALLVAGFIVAYIIQNFFVFDNIITYIITVSLFAFVHSISLERPAHRRRVAPESMLIAAAGVAVITVIVIYAVNVNEISAARQLIRALSSFSTETTVEGVLGQFDKALEYNSFGNTEIRERLADSVVQVALSPKQNIGEPFLTILDQAARGLEQESARQPLAAKYPIFLGKLYTIRGNITGKDFEKAEQRFVRAKEISPNYIQTYLGLAELYLVSSQHDKAVEIAREAYALPDNPSTLGALYYPVISIQVLSGAYKEAIDFMRAYTYTDYLPQLSAVSNTEELRLLVDRGLSNSKDLQGRLVFFEELLKRADHAAVYVGIAQTYGEMGDRANALEYANKALAKDPSLKEQVDQFLKSLEILP